jgi:anti-anti-sigma factor
MNQIQSEVVDKMVNVTLPPVLDIPGSEALRDSILDALAPGMNLTLNSEQVEQVTTPGLQILLAVAECAARREATFKVVHPSEALIEAFRESGLFSNLMAWDLE